MYTIENDYLKVGLLQKGAELRSVVDKRDRYEWIWQADGKYWAKSSPILFPVVGALKEGRLIYAGKSYSIPRHGFARDNDFDLVEKTETSLVFAFESNETTRNYFPFDFSLRVRYELKENRLEVGYTVFNPSSDELHFSLGAHPAFNCVYDQVGTSCCLEFPADDILDRYYLHNNMLSKTSDSVKLENHCLFLNKDTFKADAWIFKHLNSNSVHLKSINRQLTFSFEGFPYFGLWSAQGGDFICLEPWQGLPDHADHNLLFSEKEGIVKLDKGETWEAKWSIVI